MPQSTFSYSTDPAMIDTFEPKVYNMTFWSVYPETFTSEYALTENDCLEAVANMNRELNKFNIFVKYNGINTLTSDEYYFIEHKCPNDELIDDPKPYLNPTNPNFDPLIHDPTPDVDFGDFITEPGNFDTNSLNTYVFYDSCGFAGVQKNAKSIGVRYSLLNEWHTVHEMGHIFGLVHTHASFQSPEFAERVTRNQNDPLYNADLKGDKITDTPAMPRFTIGSAQQDFNVDPDTCEFVGTNTNIFGEQFVISDVDTKNFMNNGTECPFDALLPNVQGGFTIGQGVRMHERITTSNSLAQTETTFEALYEPYKGAYSTTVNTTISPIFQPGFDYKFIRCFGNYPQPSYYNEVFGFNRINVGPPVGRYETDFSTIYQPNNSAIIIEQLVQFDEVFEAQKCYKPNGNGYPTFGTKTQFNDGVFNYNITIAQLDSAAVNNPQFIDQLDPGLYRIEKTHQDGSVEDNVILKENE